ncbi:MAG: helix-turn-helix transcriptional regulator, partial [Steroidobacteraceae bacterium]
DGIGVVADDGGGRFATFFAPMAFVGTLPPRVARDLECVAVHISAGWRLRRSLRRTAAVMTSSGKVLHAEGEAQSASARDILRDAARAVDRARGALRQTDPSEALALWRALAGGRWSIVDQFESDGKRFLVAHENAPSPPGPAALDARERQVLTFTAMGHSLKLMAYELGLSLSTVSEIRADAMRKMRLKSRADVVRLLAGAEDVR